MIIDYTKKDIYRAYENIGIKQGQVVFIESDLASLGLFESQDVQGICRAHVEAIADIIGKDGAILVSTPTDSIIKTGEVYDPDNTPSEWGYLAEYVRNIDGTVRSIHPSTSFSAYGKEAEFLCTDNGRYAYGPHTPLYRALQTNAWFVSIGINPQFTPTVVHQVEMDVGVPYRYVREFEHRVKFKNGIRAEQFYRYVWYYTSNIKKNYNESLWRIFANQCEILSANLGRGSVYGYSMKGFYDLAVRLMVDNPYLLLEAEPVNKPYTESM